MLTCRRSSPYVFIGVLLISGLLQLVSETDAGVVEKNRSPFELRDAAIREALVSISTGKLPPTDDRLVELIADNVREAAVRANDPSVGIDVAARLAQEAVSEVTAAYTAVIFQSKSVLEAGRLFNRFEKTVDKIVDFAKSGNFAVRLVNDPGQKTGANV